MKKVTKFFWWNEKRKKFIQNFIPFDCLIIFGRCYGYLDWNSSFVASSAAVFIPFVSFHFFTIHCKCSIVYSSSCYPLLYLHFHSITFVRGFWFSLFPLSHSPTLSFISRRNGVQKKTEMKFIQLHVVGVIVIIGYY